MPCLRRSRIAGLALVLAAPVLACRENLVRPAPNAASVQVAPESLTVAEGDSALVTATARDASGQVMAGVPLTWVSSDSNIAWVTPEGVVRALAPGVVSLTVTDGEHTARLRLTVRPRVTAILIQPQTATLVPGGRLTLALVTYGRTGIPIGPRTVAWEVSDTMVARVSGTGELAALRDGEAWVHAAYDARRDSARVRVVTVTFTAVSAGPFQSTCATGPQGTFCWGNESFAGNLGAGVRLEASSTPLGVLGGDALRTVRAGDAFSCALDAGGLPHCWGSGAFGRLGDGTLDSVRAAPVAVAGHLVLASLSAGRRHTCGLAASGQAWCWGGNSTGALGVPRELAQSAVPVPVGADPVLTADGGDEPAFRAIGAGYLHTCALASDGTAWCWGRGAQLGDGVGLNRSEPRPVAGGHRFASLSVGSNHTCGVIADGTAWCWGYNVAGELGSAAAGALAPVAVQGGPAFASVAAGPTATCGLSADGAAYCWGSNFTGQAGTGDTVTDPTPRPVAGGLRFAQLSVGYAHACGLATDGLLYCWGSRLHGMLGDGREDGFAAAPVPVLGQRGSGAGGAARW